MVALEQLTLNGALTLLIYPQCFQQHEFLKADAIAATLCEMLTQLEDSFPGITAGIAGRELIAIWQSLSC